MVRRLAPAGFALAVLVAPAPSASAAPFSYADSRADTFGNTALSPQVAGLDIVAVTYAMRIRRVGGRPVPRSIVVTIALAAPPLDGPGVGYRAFATIEGCGSMQVHYSPGQAIGRAGLVGEGNVHFACGVTRFVWPRVRGNEVSWEVPVETVPPVVEPGVRFSGFRAVSDVSEPVMGVTGTGLYSPLLPGAADVATSTASWSMG